jgi:hypothetical protein
MNDPILDIAMTRRTLSESEALMPWGEDRARHARQIIVVVCASCALLAAFLVVAA